MCVCMCMRVCMCGGASGGDGVGCTDDVVVPRDNATMPHNLRSVQQIRSNTLNW